MATSELKAKARSGVGKGAARAVRREGLVPAVIYGDKQDPLPISIGYNETNLAIYAGGFLSHVITIDLDGKKHRVIPRDYQLDPVMDKPVHVDFLRVGAHTKLSVQVAIHFINHDQSPGIKKGGVVNIVHHTLQLSVPADAIPESLTVDLSGKDIGDTIHLAAITLPPGASVRSHEKDMTIATIAAPSALKSEEAAAPAAADGAAAAPAAGAPAAGAAPAKGAAAPAKGAAAPAKGAAPAAPAKK
jgi:large subunit ribosomal protein L25